jgi:hypothetical protein
LFVRKKAKNSKATAGYFQLPIADFQLKSSEIALFQSAIGTSPIVNLRLRPENIAKLSLTRFQGLLHTSATSYLLSRVNGDSACP